MHMIDVLFAEQIRLIDDVIALTEAVFPGTKKKTRRKSSKRTPVATSTEVVEKPAKKRHFAFQSPFGRPARIVKKPGKPGGQPGNGNALKNGRYSAETRFLKVKGRIAKEEFDAMRRRAVRLRWEIEKLL